MRFRLRSLELPALAVAGEAHVLGRVQKIGNRNRDDVIAAELAVAVGAAMRAADANFVSLRAERAMTFREIEGAVDSAAVAGEGLVIEFAVGCHWFLA